MSPYILELVQEMNRRFADFNNCLGAEGFDALGGGEDVSVGYSYHHSRLD